jgi:hypothetical protein
LGILGVSHHIRDVGEAFTAKSGFHTHAFGLSIVILFDGIEGAQVGGNLSVFNLDGSLKMFAQIFNCGNWHKSIFPFHLKWPSVADRIMNDELRD